MFGGDRRDILLEHLHFVNTRPEIQIIPRNSSDNALLWEDVFSPSVQKFQKGAFARGVLHEFVAIGVPNSRANLQVFCLCIRRRSVRRIVTNLRE